MDVVYTLITVRNWSKDFFSTKPWPSSGHEVMSLGFFFIHLMDTVYSTLLSGDKSFIAASLQHIDILSDKEQSGPSCSKLTMSLVNDSLKFTSSDTQIC